MRQRDIEEGILYREEEREREREKEMKDTTIEGDSIAHLTTAEGPGVSGSQSSCEGVSSTKLES